MGTGILGLIFFLSGWLLLPAFYLAKNRDWLGLLILGSIAIALVTEVYFDRTMGGMVVGFLVPFLLTDNKRETKS